MCSAHGNLYAVMKAILKKHGMDIGSVRKPLSALVDSDLAVVLPTPGGPHNINDDMRPASIILRRTAPSPTKCFCPT